MYIWIEGQKKRIVFDNTPEMVTAGVPIKNRCKNMF